VTHRIPQRWDEWVAAITQEDTQQAIGGRLGASRSTVARRLKTPDASFVLSLARAYGANPLQGLWHAGLLMDADFTDAWRAEVLKHAPPEALMLELCRRVDAQGRFRDR
jgi:hypothetical protein